MKIILDLEANGLKPTEIWCSCKACGKQYKAYHGNHRHCSERCREKSKYFSCKIPWHALNPTSRMWSQAKYRAKNKNLAFNISKEDILIPEFCPILGVKLEPHKGKRGDSSPSLDRVDSTKGYTKDNIQVVSNRANQIKNNASLEELEKIVNYLKCRS